MNFYGVALKAGLFALSFASLRCAKGCRFHP